MVEQTRVELPPVLESILRYQLAEARERLEAGEELVPFSALAAGETLFCEQHDFPTAEQCHADVRHTVEHARGAAGYGFCYDGYVDTDAGRKDALIAQGGVPGAAQGYAIALLYETSEDGALTFEDEPVVIGECPNFMVDLVLESDDGAGEVAGVSSAASGEAACVGGDVAAGWAAAAAAGGAAAGGSAAAAAGGDVAAGGAAAAAAGGSAAAGAAAAAAAGGSAATDAAAPAAADEATSA